MEIIATLGIGLLLAFSLWIISALYRNYRIAQSTGLPLLISPINPVNPVWILLRPYINPLFSQLPFKIGYFAQYNYLGWEWHDKNQLHTIYGPVFMIVTPTENHLILADKAACEYVFKHIRDWQMNPAFNAPLEIFGSNVGTAEGHAWQRQRRITGMAFNERNSNLVWDESTKQAAQVLRSWIQAPPSKGVTTTVTDANLLALHVLAGAGFGITYDFESPLTAVTPGHAMSYRDALQALLDNIFITFAISMLRVPSFSLPYAMRRVLTAMKEFKLYTAEMVENERAVYARSNSSSKVNLLSSIVRASVEAANSKSDGIMGTLTRGSLSDEEILGNLFAFNVAGQDTTASTISYAIALLACHPAYQRWLKEELDRVFGTKGIQNFQYEDVYPRLKRCQAVMYETLRLFPPLPSVPRATGATYCNLPLGDKTHSIPPWTAVWGNVAAIQVDEQYWGPEAKVWRPSRWIRKGDSGDVEELVEAVGHAYIPWASGPRVCPGKKFAQVEIVAVVASLMHRHSVAAVLEEGETEASAQERLTRVIADSDMTLVMRMNHPQKLRVRWEKVAS